MNGVVSMSSQTLKIKEFQVNKVSLGKNYSFDKKELVIPEHVPEKMPPEFHSVNIHVLAPHKLKVQTDSIMDVVPISAKALGKIGEGVTHTLDGVSMIITGADEDGRQIHDFGSSEGILQDRIVLNRDGTPNENDFIIMFNVILNSNTELTRQLMTKIFNFADDFLQPIRVILKKTNGRYADFTSEYVNAVHPGKPKVAVVKEIAGQGAMYDNILFPEEPSGMKSGVSIIDINNFPVLLTPNECRDGIIHAMV